MIEIKIDELQNIGVRNVCTAGLTIATELADIMVNTTIIGGVVPSLLIDQNSRSDGFAVHSGTTDLDLAISLELLKDEMYAKVNNRLEDGGFEPARNEKGNPTPQTWIHESLKDTSIDFLISSNLKGKTQKIKHLTKNLAAIPCLGLEYAFRERVQISLFGRNAHGAILTRSIWVCDIAPFISLKAIALRGRGGKGGKDAYDIYYILKYTSQDIDTIAHSLNDNLDDDAVKTAIDYLKDDFATIDSLGPVKAAIYMGNEQDIETQVDVYAVVQELLRRI